MRMAPSSSDHFYDSVPMGDSSTTLSTTAADDYYGSSSTVSSTSTVTSDNVAIHVRISGTDVRAKEVILVCLALALLVFSVSLFFKHWKKNYWDINQLPYYAYLYKTDEEMIPTATDILANGGGSVGPELDTQDVICSLSRSPSIRPGFSRSRHSSFRTDNTSLCMEPMNSSSRVFVPRPTSFHRNRASFIHVTAEAMQQKRHKEGSLRLQANPWQLRRTRSGIDRSHRGKGGGRHVILTSRASLQREQRRTNSLQQRKSSLGEICDYELEEKKSNEEDIHMNTLSSSDKNKTEQQQHSEDENEVLTIVVDHVAEEEQVQLHNEQCSTTVI